MNKLISLTINNVFYIVFVTILAWIVLIHWNLHHTTQDFELGKHTEEIDVGTQEREL